MKKKLIIIFPAAIILFGGVSILNLFVFGKVKEVSSIGIQDLSVTNETVSFSPVFMTSADIMGSYSYRLENNTMYIKIKSVLAGGIGKSKVEIKGKFSTIKKIVLEDKENEKVIWDRNADQSQDGYVPNEEAAIKIAEAVWTSIYGNLTEKSKPFIAKYHEEGDYWEVHGTLPGNTRGGVPEIKISRVNGSVLYVNHTR